MSFHGTVGEVTEVSQSCFEWKIFGFLTLSGEEGDRYLSPNFNAFGVSWYLKIFPSGFTNVLSPGQMSLSLNCHSPRLQTLIVTLGIRGPEGVEHKKSQELLPEYSVCIWNGIPRSKLEAEASRLLPGNALVIVLDIKGKMDWFTKDSSTQTVPDYLPSAEDPSIENKALDEQEGEILQRSEQNTPNSGEDYEATLKEEGMEELKKSLQRLLANVEDSDVIIKVRGQEFRAHRAIIRSRSPVFQAMFAHNMLEKQSGQVAMEDCDPESFPDFLDHIYTGSVEMVSSRNVASLFSASDKYDLGTLKKACVGFLKKNLSVASFCDTITLAIKYDLKDLVELATEFFCNHTLDIIETVEWQIFVAENPTVGNELHIKQLRKQNRSAK